MDALTFQDLMQSARYEEERSFDEATCSYLRIICCQLQGFQESLQGHVHKMGDHPSYTGPAEVPSG